jgi:hypothetical protein
MKDGSDGNFQLDRRSFLSGLVAVSILPASLRNLPTEEIVPSDEIWKVVEEEPTIFIIRSGGTIDLAVDIAPITRGEAFDFGSYELQSAKILAERANEVQPIMWALQEQYENFRTVQLNELYATEDDERIQAYEEKWPEYANEELTCIWVENLSTEEFRDLCTEMEKWSESEPNWLHEADYFDVPASGQDYSLTFFRDYTDPKVLERLGIEIIEGEHPGSTYYAAELTIPVEDANRRAEEAGIPIRFSAEEG